MAIDPELLLRALGGDRTTALEQLDRAIQNLPRRGQSAEDADRERQRLEQAKLALQSS